MFTKFSKYDEAVFTSKNQQCAIKSPFFIYIYILAYD